MSSRAVFDDEGEAIRVTIEDVREALETVPRDQVGAFEIYLHELDQLLNNRATCELQRKLAAAALENDLAIDEALRLEQQAISDRQVAGRLSGRTATISEEAQEQVRHHEIDNEAMLAHVTNGLSIESDDDSTTVISDAGQTCSVVTQNSSSTGSVERYLDLLRAEENRPSIICMICEEDYHPTVTSTLNCRHIWCRHCLREQFEAATRSESSWPPRCCGQTIAAENIRVLLNPSLLARYAAKSIEWATTNRTYCHENTCSEFILPQTITGRRARCPRCERVTCSECKKAYHVNEPCPEDSENDNILRQMAEENGWPRCPGCDRYVEITHGCNHMTCLCRTQFCYQCSREWKQCQCPQFTEHLLLAEEERVVNREGIVGEAAREEVRRNILERHECAHTGDFTRTGGGICDECNQLLPNYLMRCQGCHIAVCRRCRFQRI